MKPYKSLRFKGNGSLSMWLVSILVVLLSSCIDQMDEYYEKPGWLKGNIYQILEQDGNYSLFLQGLDRAGFKQMVNGKSILTVMAPNDSAFASYLQTQYGTTQIELLPLEELKKIMGFHIMYYAFNTEKLINFRPDEGDAATDEDKMLNAGLYYKHRTKSMDPISVEWDATRGDSVKIYHHERFLPVFSHLFFQTKQIDPVYNYEYFFPQTPWKGGNNGFNVSNAAVDAYQLIASNGYVYKIDRVLRPLQTIYDELRAQEDYSTFLDLYNKYVYFAEVPELTVEYGNGSKLFQMYHKTPLANIACEWPEIDYSNMSNLSKVAYSVFAPSNAAIQRFFDNYWKVGGYDTLTQVSRESIEYLLFNSVYTESVAFPEEIKKSLIINSYGTPIEFDVDAVPEENRILCVNGVFYGLDEVAAPLMFRSVTGPAFQYKQYGYFLKMLKASNLMMTLSSNETRYLCLIPSNAQIESIGITVNRDDNLILNNSLLSGSVQTSYVYAHTVSLDATPGSYTELPSTGAHVFRTLSPTYNLYWYVLDGKITNSVLYNERIFPSAPADESTLFSPVYERTFEGHEWSNGKVYAYDSLFFDGSYDRTNYKKFQGLMYNNRSDETLPYQAFASLLDMAGLYNAQAFNFVFEKYLAFVPTTQAVHDALLANRIPGIDPDPAWVDDETVPFMNRFVVSDAEALKQYLMMYFIPESTAGVSNYPFVGWNEAVPNGLPTLDVKEVYDSQNKLTLVTTHLDVEDTGSALRVRVRKAGSEWIDVLADYHYFPFIFDDGCIHFITRCF
ncbi:MAG: fasciclin domain-containing protein [Bacteroidales bacterium]|nr:fasciclin domain-containing protein [Bacteroidales bacterium]